VPCPLSIYFVPVLFLTIHYFSSGYPILSSWIGRGLYIGKYSPPPREGEKYQPMSFGGKILKVEEKKRENVKEKEARGRKRKKGERIR
jgi:hypothetical protein